MLNNVKFEFIKNLTHLTSSRLVCFILTIIPHFIRCLRLICIIRIWYIFIDNLKMFIDCIDSIIQILNQLIRIFKCPPFFCIVLATFILCLSHSLQINFFILHYFITSDQAICEICINILKLVYVAIRKFVLFSKSKCFLICIKF